MNKGRFNPRHPVESLGITPARTVYYNLGEPGLMEEAIRRGEGRLGKGGVLLVSTGSHTGRSPGDKYIVRSPENEAGIWWESNQAMDPESFSRLEEDMTRYLSERDCFVQDLYACASPEHRLNTRMVTELAWHGLFVRNLLRRPEVESLDSYEPDCAVINCPGFSADPERHGSKGPTAIALNLERKTILICGTAYAGENKKSVFSLLNYMLPAKGVMPMHCSANHAHGDPDSAAVFFGLSGTGKTTLSADSSRTLIGDDEHGWSDSGTFNFEGGCYAKTISLSPEAEPEIYAATKSFGTVVENMVYDEETREIDFEDESITANTRCAYQLSCIPNASATGMGGQPRHVIMLTCDAFGVLPPIARLSPAQAMYHFLSGFTSKTAGTEQGIREPKSTFSACFGAPFMPLRPEVYGSLLRERISRSGASCWLVNTGWTGGPYGVGKRMPIQVTKSLLSQVLSGALEKAEFRVDENFRFEVPARVEGVPESVMNPRSAWSDPEGYDAQARRLRKMFADNFAQFDSSVDAETKGAAL